MEQNVCKRQFNWKNEKNDCKRWEKRKLLDETAVHVY